MRVHLCSVAFHIDQLKGCKLGVCENNVAGRKAKICPDTISPVPHKEQRGKRAHLFGKSRSGEESSEMP